MALFSGYFYGFKTDINHGMMTCRDMFDMFSSTCLSCDMGAWHFFSSIFFSSQTLTMGVFEPDFEETDTSLRWGEGRLKMTLCTEAGILVFDMGG